MKKTLATIAMVLAATSAHAEEKKLTWSETIAIKAATKLYVAGNNAADKGDWTTACFKYGAANHSLLDVIHKSERMSKLYDKQKLAEGQFCMAAGIRG